MFFVFRNNTVERFFEKGYLFSGYDDISVVPQDVDGYIWWYQLPICPDQGILSDVVRTMASKLHFVLSGTDGNKPFIVFTMDAIFNIPFCDDDFRVNMAVMDYNKALMEAAHSHANVKILDITEFTRRYSVNDLVDWKFYFISQLGMNPKLHKEFKSWFSRKMESIALKRKKCLVLDLDNTLWGGILGEDGIDGIQIGGDYPGKAFRYWQEYLKQLAGNGVILAVCSKNNEEDVIDAWERNPFMILHKEDFSAWRINWADKATNIRELSSELNIGLDSMVFLDDNPSERELIRQALPMVSVPEFPEQPYMLPAFFQTLVSDYFKVYSITEEDKNKTAQYKANAERTRAQAAFADFDKFLESLDIRITLSEADEFNIKRIAQMTQKTNQFNLTTRRYTEADIRSFVESGWRIWCISVADRFGDNGITGCILVNGSEIDSFLLSCRILGKGIEKVFVKKVLSLLLEADVTDIKASYLPTSKNAQVKEFWESCGFTCTGIDDEGNKTYSIDLHSSDLGYNDKIYTFQ